MPTAFARPRARRATSTASAALAALAIAAPMSALSAMPAFAAEGQTGPIGSGVAYDGGDGYLGSFAIDGGQPVWCIEPGVNPPPRSGTFTSIGERDAAYFESKDPGANVVSSLNVARANWAMGDIGVPAAAAGDKVTTAAVELFNWMMIAPDSLIREAMQFGAPATVTPREAASYLSPRAGGDEAAVEATLDNIIASSAGVVDAGNPGPAGDLPIELSPGSRAGTLTVNLTGAFEGGTADVTLTNAAFDSNGNGIYDEGVDSPVANGLADGSTYTVVPTSMTPATASAQGTGHSASAVYPSVLEAYNTDVGGTVGQMVGGAVAPRTIDGPLAGSATSPFQPYIDPTVSSQITAETQYVAAGESIDDIWTVQFPGGAWPQVGGAPIEIATSGTIYGPFQVKPEATADGLVPEGAPVFQEIAPETTDGTVLGTGAGHRLVTSNPVTESGYYVFVATIDEDEQPEATKALMTDGYRFSDAFGVANETALRIADIVTEAQATAPVWGTAIDTGIVNGHIPANAEMDWTLYDNAGTPGDTSDDIVVGTAPAQPIEEGFYENLRVPSAPVNVEDHVGDLYWVERLTVGGKVEHEGQRELENETTKVTPPTVTTTADPMAYTGTTTFDTAALTGEVAPNSGLTFQYWSDPNGDTVPGDEATAADDVLITTTDRVAVEAGLHDLTEIVSPEVLASVEGRTYWVEILDTVIEDGSSKEVHRGEKGLDNETTIVGTPDVTTQADPKADTGAPFNDTALIEGLIEDGTTVGFTAYQKPVAGEPKLDIGGVPRADGAVWTQAEIDAMVGNSICEAQTIANLTPVAVPAGIHDEAISIESADITTSVAGEVNWVETLYAEDGTVIHRGECGIENETTLVTTPPTPPTQPAPAAGNGGSGLAATGSDAAPMGLLAAAAAGALVLGAAIRRRLGQQEG